MATLPSEVQPGDTISSELMTTILRRLSQLSDVVLTGTQPVPDVIGKTLADGRMLIQQPSRQLALGFVVDVTGTAINPNAGGSSDLVILNQSPIAGHLATVNSFVNLVVSKDAGSLPNPGPGPQPVIDKTETLEGEEASDFAVGNWMVLVGSGFNANAAQNIVTFDGVKASDVDSDPTSPSNRLRVQVPTGIPNAPKEPGAEPVANVVLAINLANANVRATTRVNITAPVENAPTITSVEPHPAREGERITINGTNLSSIEKVTIKYQDIVKEATNVNAEDRKIDATVPDVGIPQDGLPYCTLTVVTEEVSVTTTVSIAAG